MKGLVNLGNTCYLNSVLQCFIYSKSFKEFINENSTKIIIQALQEIITTDQKVVNPQKFVLSFIKEKPWFSGFEQNDSHEFLIVFLDLLLTLTKKDIINHSYSWKKFKSSHDLKLIQGYYGEMKTTVICDECKNKSITYSEFNTINLNIPQKENDLIDLFSNFLSPEEQNDPENLFFCEKCAKNTKSIKKYCINRLPNNLIIILNRYSSSGRKNNGLVKFPVESLLVNEKVSNEIRDYHLTGFINHYGLLMGGHYNSVNLVDDKWYFVDDTSIVEIQKMDPIVSNKNTYIMFYSIKE
jgi:ubiquitin C-terminal hydrolase